VSFANYSKTDQKRVFFASDFKGSFLFYDIILFALPLKMHEQEEAGILHLNLVDSARQDQIRHEVVSFAKELAESGSFFSFPSIVQIGEKQKSLLKMIKRFRASLNPYQLKDGNYRGALINAKEALWGLDLNTLEQVADRNRFFDSVEKGVLGFQSKAEEQLAKQASETPEEQRQRLAKFALSQLAENAAFAASFANYQDRLKYRLNPFGICLKIHQLGAWSLGFSEERNGWDDLTEKFFAIFPVIFSTISSETHLPEDRKRLYVFKVNINIKGRVSGSFLDFDKIEGTVLPVFNPLVSKAP